MDAGIINSLSVILKTPFLIILLLLLIQKKLLILS